MTQGVIVHRDLASKLRDFSGLCFGKISPTDIDAFLEFGDKAYVFIEAKYKNAQLPYGQKLALERLVDCVGATRKALLIVCSHKSGPDEDIDIGACEVKAYRSRGQWRIPPNGNTVRKMIDEFMKFVARGG